MLPRVLEVEAMDTAGEAQTYDAMDHSHVNRVFVQDFLAIWKGRGLILDVGTGTAQIPIELCRQHPEAQVLGVDLAAQMLKVGQANIAQAKLDNNIRLQQVDAKGLPFGDGTFVATISNSIVHHIPEPKSVLAEMLRVTALGGVLFVRDLLRPESDAEVSRLVALYAEGASDHAKQLFDDSLRAALTLEEIRFCLQAIGANPDDVRQTTDRHWTWCAVRH